MKRIAIGALAAVVSLSVLVACSKQEEVKPVPAGEKPAPSMSPEAPAKEGAEKPSAPAPAEPASKLAELAKVAESSFSLDQLKSMAGSLSTGDLKTTADTLVTALKGQDGTLQSMKEKLSKISPTDLGSMADLKKSVSGAEKTIAELRAKLQVVVDSLKEKGVDVSAYTSFLTGK